MTGETTWFQHALGRLSRVTSTGRFMPVVDGLRFVSILSVVLFHLQPTFAFHTGQEMPSHWLLRLIDRGDFGVRLFFTISGFILALPFAEAAFRGTQWPRSSPYFKRRLTRLEPPYLVCLSIMFPLVLVLKDASFGELLPHFLATVIYQHSVIYGQTSTVHGATWSLEVEVQFYVLAPLLARVFTVKSAPSRRTLLIATIVALSVANTAYRISDATDENLRYFLSLPFHLPYFLAGYLLADFHVAAEAPDQPKTLSWDLVGLIGWGALATALLVTSRDYNAALAPIVFVACAGTYRGRVLSRLFSIPLITTVGGMCYTIYLYHPLILGAVGRATFPLTRPEWPFAVNYALHLVLVLPMVVVVGAVLFAIFERPFMQRDWWRRVMNRAGSARGLPGGQQAQGADPQ